MAPDITECINCELIYTTVLRHSSKDVLFGYGIDVYLFLFIYLFIYFIFYFFYLLSFISLFIYNPHLPLFVIIVH